MSETIVIDGYNLIKQWDELIDLEVVSLEEGRKGLIRILAAYKKSRGHDITIVFDGWKSDNIGSSHDRIQGVDIIYSGRGEKADEVIKRISDELRAKVVIVTSDKAIETHALKRGSAVIPSADFEMRVRLVSQEEEYGCFDEEEYQPPTGGNKKGPARRLSKEERKKQQKLKKL
ncbi:MAG: NYN domain-containing protein [Proteobacteria bacterium]|nr:NYN domain-containing protein [Pseudomonadota bacterium]